VACPSQLPNSSTCLLHSPVTVDFHGTLLVVAVWIGYGKHLYRTRIDIVRRALHCTHRRNCWRGRTDLHPHPLITDALQGSAHEASLSSNWRMLRPALGSVRYMSPLRST